MAYHEMNIADRARWRQLRSTPTDWSTEEVRRWNRSRRQATADYAPPRDGAGFYRICERWAGRLFRALTIAAAVCLVFVVLRIGIAFVDGSIGHALDAIRSAQ